MTSTHIYQSDKTIKFIAKAKLKHGDRYDYSLVEYINSRTKVKIICKIHGVFEMSPDNHLSGQNCGRCAGNGKKTTSLFILDAINVHGNTYDYSNVFYTTAATKVDIGCEIHGMFSQTPNSHLRGAGCPECGNIRISEMGRSNSDEFIKKANIVHSFEYTYVNTNYVKTIEKVLITCFIHGDFLQSPNNHLCGNGCPSCVGNVEQSVDRFIEESISIHGNRYVYDKVVYDDATTHVIVGCKIHGDFKVTPNKHLGGSGCVKCSKRVSGISIIWLDSLKNTNLVFEYDIPEYPTYKPVDGYDPLTNTVYQFHGDFWHGNLNNPKYPADGINRRNKKTYGELNRLTNESDDWIRSQGYNLIVMWEMDFRIHLKSLRHSKAPVQ